MANPGPYPPMGPPMGGPMQPMGGPPMGGSPMGPGGPGSMMPRPPMRQGTSRVVPVVVAAGLAVGVFCGLLFGLGTGKHRASADPEKVSNGVKRADEPTVDPSAIDTTRKPAPPVAAAPPPAAPVATPPPAEPASTKIVVEVKPDAAAQTAKVFIDGKEIAGTSFDLPMPAGITKQRVKVLVKAQGYKDVEQAVDAEGESTNLKVELTKGRSPPVAATPDPDAAPRPAASAPPPSTTAPAAPKPATPKPAAPKKKANGGLIDI